MKCGSDPAEREGVTNDFVSFKSACGLSLDVKSFDAVSEEVDSDFAITLFKNRINRKNNILIIAVTYLSTELIKFCLLLALMLTRGIAMSYYALSKSRSP